MESRALNQARWHLTQYERLEQQGEDPQAVHHLSRGLSLLFEFIEDDPTDDPTNDVANNIVTTYEQSILSQVRALLKQESTATESSLRHYLAVMETFKTNGFGESEEFDKVHRELKYTILIILPILQIPSDRDRDAAFDAALSEVQKQLESYRRQKAQATE